MHPLDEYIEKLGFERKLMDFIDDGWEGSRIEIEGSELIYLPSDDPEILTLCFYRQLKPGNSLTDPLKGMKRFIRIVSEADAGFKVIRGLVLDSYGKNQAIEPERMRRMLETYGAKVVNGERGYKWHHLDISLFRRRFGKYFA